MALWGPAAAGEAGGGVKNSRRLAMAGCDPASAGEPQLKTLGWRLWCIEGEILNAYPRSIDALTTQDSDQYVAKPQRFVAQMRFEIADRRLPHAEAHWPQIDHIKAFGLERPSDSDRVIEALWRILVEVNEDMEWLGPADGSR